MKTLTVRQKLIIAMVIVGGAMGTLNSALIWCDLAAKANQANTATAQANDQVDTINRELRSGLDSQVAAGAITADEANTSFDDQMASETPIGSQEKFGWLYTLAIVTILTFAMLIVATGLLWFRDPTSTFTWAESLVLLGILIYFLIVVNGFIPHFLIDIWDNVFPKKQGTFVVPLSGEIARLFSDHAIWWEWAWFIPRDMIVAGWYVVTLVAMIAAWYWTQEWPRRAPHAERDATSPYGRPILSAGR